MVCKECGKIINDNEEVCPFCHEKNFADDTTATNVNDIDKLFQKK